MRDEAQFRWLEQQGEAFGAPGMEPRWTSSLKDAVGTAYSASSRIWFTCSHGILNEIYHPTIDRPQVRDMEFLVTDGETFAHEEKRDLLSTFEYLHAETLGVRYVNRDPEGRYSLTKEIICDPHHAVILQRLRLEGRDDLLPRLKVYALLAPHLDGGGAGNSARAVDVAGHKTIMAWKNHWSLMMTSSCGFSKVSCGFVGSTDGWRDVMNDFRMDWEFGSATNGNVAVMGELDLQCAAVEGGYECTVAIGIGDGHHTAAQKTMSALATPFEQHRSALSSSGIALRIPEWLAAKAQDEGKLMRASHNVLLAHEDKTFSGAFVASASIPWGQVKGDDDLGGYHLVWTRDMVQTATALMACGRAETARRALVYLACTQQPTAASRRISGSTEPLLDAGSNWTRSPFRSSWRGGSGRRTRSVNWKFSRLSSGRRAISCATRRLPTRSDGKKTLAIRPRHWPRSSAALICAAEIARAHESQ